MSLVSPPKYRHLQQYPTVDQFKGILTGGIAETDGTRRAIDVLEGPIETYTNLPFRIVNYLYNNKERDVPRDEVVKHALQAGYDKDHIYRAIKEFISKQPNIGIWYKDKTTWLRWYDMSKEEFNERKKALDKFNIQK